MDSSKIIGGGATGIGLGAAAVYIAGRFGVHLTAEDGALISSGLVAAVAFIAHNGIRGVGRIIWRGGSSPAPSSSTAAPEAPPVIRY